MTVRTAIVALMSALLLTGPATVIQTAAAAAPPTSHPTQIAAHPSEALPSAALRALRASVASPRSRAALPGSGVVLLGPRAAQLGSRVGLPGSRAALPDSSAARLASRAALLDRPSTAELDERIAGAARQLEILVEQYNASREDLRATRQRISDLGSRLAPLTRELEERQSLVNGLMSSTYQRTRSGPTVALFAAEQPHEFVDKLLVLHQLASGEQRAAEELHRTRTRLDDTRATLNALAAQQTRQQTELNTRKATVKGEIAALKQMRAIAYGGGSRYPAMGTIPTPDYVPGAAGDVVAFAFRQLGKPYRWGSAGPGSYDCSGLTLSAWRTAGVSLPHNAASQYASTSRVNRDQLRPGDLVFFYSPISHVGVYIGGGRMIHAPEFGEHVRVASIDSLPIHGFGRPG